MSVRKTERETSNIEFLKVLRDIEVFLLDRQNVKPKKFRYFFNQHLISHSANAYSNAKMGNSVYVTTLEEKKLRKYYFQKSKQEVQALSSQIDVMYEIYKSDVLTNGELQYIAGLLNDAFKLLNGVIASDKKRYKDIIE